MFEIIEKIKEELARYTDSTIEEYELIRSKDGVWLFRGKYKNRSVVIKYFEHEDDKREIRNYQLLNQLKISTMDVLLYGSTFLILEDIKESSIWRLGTEEDLDDITVANNLAHWYFEFHERGYSYDGIDTLYCEMDAITRENLLQLRNRFVEGKELVQYMLDHIVVWDRIKKKYSKTLNYNDFYWTNLLVGVGTDKAFPYDYNYLGAGYRENDIINVTSSLSKEAGELFFITYNQLYHTKYGVDRQISEIDVKKLCEVSCVLFTLIKGYEMEELPWWVEEEREKALTKEFYDMLKELIQER